MARIDECAWGVIFALAMPIIALGGICPGILAPAEASRHRRMVHGLIAGPLAISGECRPRDLPRSAFEAAARTGMILPGVMSAPLFSFAVVSQGASRSLSPR
jgi:TRAP-type C4-dicarboxylate transport system permease large subunit